MRNRAVFADFESAVDLSASSFANAPDGARAATELTVAPFGGLPPEGLRLLMLLAAVGFALETVVAVALRGNASNRTLAAVEQLGAWCTLMAMLPAACYVAAGAYQLLRVACGGLGWRTLASSALPLAAVVALTALRDRLPPLILLIVIVVVSLGMFAAAALVFRAAALRPFAMGMLGWLVVCDLRTMGWVQGLRITSAGSFNMQSAWMFGDAARILEAALLLGLAWWLASSDRAGRRGVAIASGVSAVVILLLACAPIAAASPARAALEALGSGGVHAAFAGFDSTLPLVGLSLAVAMNLQLRNCAALSAGFALLVLSRGRWDVPASALFGAVGALAIAHAAAAYLAAAPASVRAPIHR